MCFIKSLITLATLGVVHLQSSGVNGCSGSSWRCMLQNSDNSWGSGSYDNTWGSSTDPYVTGPWNTAKGSTKVNKWNQGDRRDVGSMWNLGSGMSGSRSRGRPAALPIQPGSTCAVWDWKCSMLEKMDKDSLPSDGSGMSGVYNGNNNYGSGSNGNRNGKDNRLYR